MQQRLPHRPTGIVFVVSGPSGSGKGSVTHPLMAADPRLEFSVSATTRPSREGEVHGREYFFVDRAEFEQAVKAGQMLEHAQYAGNLYGTPRAAVREALDQGKDVLLEIEPVGARQVRAVMPAAVLVLILPPSAAELSDRLRRRGTDSEEAIQRRQAAYASELASWPLYDYLVVNDDLDRAIEELRAIIAAERARLRRLDMQTFLDRNYGDDE